MEDYQSMNDKLRPPKRTTMQAAAETRTNDLLRNIKSTQQEQHESQNDTTTNTTKNNTRTPHEIENHNLEPETCTQLETTHEYEKPQREDGIIYADDANIITEYDANEQISTRLGNYDRIASSRNVGIQWEKSESLPEKNTGNSKKHPRGNLQTSKLNQQEQY